MNAHYMKTLPFDEILPHLIAFLPEKDATSPAMLARLASMWPHIAPRAQTLEEAATAALPVLTDPTQTYTPDDTVIMDEGHHALHEVYDILAPMEQFENEPIHEALKAVVEKLGGGFKAVGRPVRVALTAQTGGPDLSAIMVALGQKETLRRLKVALHHVHERGHGHH
jgi:glutamyl-tRNA synthetase